MHADAAAAVPASAAARRAPQLRAVLLCDLADSTALIEALGDAPAAELMRRHDRVARDLMHRHGGREIDKTDGFLVLFERPVRAVAFALDYQRALRTLGEELRRPLRARIGVHVGEVVLWDNAAADIADGAKPIEVEGLAKPVAARLMALARPGQILLSETARTLAQRAHGELEDAAQVRWLAHGRYRIKGVPQPLTVHEVGEAGLAPLAPPPSGPKAQRELPLWRRPAVLALEALLLLAALGISAYLALRPAPAIAFAERDWVVLGELRNLTGETLFDDALDEAFRIGLEQSRYVNVLPALQARAALQRMQKAPGVALDREVAIELALREGARAVILPTVTEFGGRVRISAEVIDPNTGATVYAESADGKTAEDVLPAMDVVLGNLRERLGESIKAIDQASAPLAKITTPSLDALRAFALAERSFAEGNIQQTFSLLDQAIALDPDFAMAYGRKATILHAMGDPAAAYRTATDALRRPEKLSARERMMLEGTVAFFAEPGAALERWETLLKVYPDVAVAENNAGLALLWFHNDPVRAAAHFRRFAEFEPKHNLRAFGWFGLAVSEVAVGELEQAREHMAQGEAFGVRPPGFEHTFAPLVARAYDELDALLKQSGSAWGATAPVERALRAAAVRLDRGDPAGAFRELDAALAAADPALPGAIRSRLQGSLAWLALEAGRDDAPQRVRDFARAQGERLDDALARYDHSAVVQLLLSSLALERVGERARAADVVSRLAGRVRGKQLVHIDRLLQAVTCVVAHPEAAPRAACLAEGVDGLEYVLTHALRMEALAAMGDFAAARREAEWLVARRGRALSEMQKYEPQLLNVAALNRAELGLIAWTHDREQQAQAKLRADALARAWSVAPDDSPFVRRLAELRASLGEQDH